MLEWILEQFLEKILGRKFWPCELNPCAVGLCGTKFKMAGRERRVLDGMWFHYSAAGIHPEPLLCCVSPPRSIARARSFPRQCSHRAHPRIRVRPLCSDLSPRSTLHLFDQAHRGGAVASDSLSFSLLSFWSLSVFHSAELSRQPNRLI